jgi:hypothetical protein
MLGGDDNPVGLPGARPATDRITTMEYALLIYGDEKVWDAADEATRQEVYAAHMEFARLCAEHGHKITGGSELRPSSSARTVRRTGESVDVTDGPFAETAEQLGGFYVIDTEDVDDLVQLVGNTLYEPTFELRPVVPASEQG